MTLNFDKCHLIDFYGRYSTSITRSGIFFSCSNSPFDQTATNEIFNKIGLEVLKYINYKQTYKTFFFIVIPKSFDQKVMTSKNLKHEG